MRCANLLVTAVLTLTSLPAFAVSWEETVVKARGQTVYWNAWGGDERTNALIAWAGVQVKARYGVTIVQVKLADTAEAVTRVIAEKAAGKTDGSVDMIWINGPNFLSMKQKGLLFGPFVQQMPNSRLVDLSEKSPNAVDFTVPVEGFESPWRKAQFVFNYDTRRVAAVPTSMVEFLTWARAHPGRFTHPDVSNFMGATFLKQALIELTPDPASLQMPVTEAGFAAAVNPLWAWYDALKPNLWRGGVQFPTSGETQRQLLSDGEIDISMSFDPASAAAAIRTGLLPESIRTATLANGTLSNTSFVAIPFNAAHKEGAEVVANFLLEPETQAHTQNIDVLGSFSVLDPSKLDERQNSLFAALPRSDALPSNSELSKTLLEPHPSWMTRLTSEWAKRYVK